jgi:hypothetical protein
VSGCLDVWLSGLHSVVLEHLAGDESALQTIMDEGCVQALVNIAAMGNAETTRLCGSAIAELAMRPLCFEKVVIDKGIPSIVSLAYESDLKRCGWNTHAFFPTTACHVLDCLRTDPGR